MANNYHPKARTTMKISKEIFLSPLRTKDAALKFNPNDRSHVTTDKSYTLAEFERNLIAEGVNNEKNFLI